MTEVATDGLRPSEPEYADTSNAARTLRDLSVRLIAANRPEALYGQIVEAAMTLMDADASSIQVLEPEGEVLDLVASRNFHPRSEAYWRSVDASHSSTCGAALREWSRVIVSDVEACEFLAGTPDLDEYRRSRLRAVQSTPLVTREGEPIGMISTHWNEPCALTEADFALFDVLARQAADLIERTRAEAALRESEERQAFLLGLSDALRAETHADAVVDVAVRMLAEEMELDRCYATAMYPAEDRVDVTHEVRRPDLTPMPSTLRFSDFPEAGRRTFDRTLIFDDAANDPDLTDADKTSLAAMSFGALLSRALRRGKAGPIWALGAVSAEPRRWTPGEVALVEEVTERAGAAMERARAETALREESRTLETLNSTGAAIAAEIELEPLVQKVTDAGVELVGADFGAFFYNDLDEDGERYMLYTLSGADRSAFENYPMPRNTAVFGPTFAGKGVIRSDDITKDPRYGKNAPHKGMPEGHLPVRSYLAVPVTSRSGEVIGGLFFGHSEPGRFSERHERLMTGIAAQAAIGIDNARLFEAAQREVEERRRAEEALVRRNRGLALVARISGELMHDTIPAGRLESVFADVAREVSADYYFSFLIDEADPTVMRLAASGGLTEAQRAAFSRIAVGEYLCGRVAARRAPVVIADLDTSDDPACAGVIALDGKCYAGFPLMVEGRLIGTISFACKSRSCFAEDQITLMTTVAGQIAAALDRQRAEQVLRESEERFREQFENANDFIFTADLEMRLTSANPAVARALGHSPKDLIGRSIADFVPPEMWERNKAMLSAKLAGEADTTRYEVEVFDPGGGRMTWEINSRLTRDASGAPTGLHAIGRDVTERKASEERLRESEERFRRIADSTPTPMWVTGLDRKRTFVNRAYVDFLGITYEEAVDFDWRDILHPEDHDRIVAESIAGEASLEPFALEARYQRTDGEWHWMRSFSQPRFDSKGELTGFIGVAHDVTDARAAEAALRTSEQRLREKAAEFEALAENVSQLAWMAEADGSVFWYNRRWYEYTGTDLESMKDWGWREVHHPDHVDRVIDEVKANWGAGEPWEGTYLLRSAEGEYRWFLTRAEPIRNEAGELVRWFGTNTDVSAQREAEAALRESEEHLRLIYDSLDEYAIITLDRRGFIVGWNEGAERLLGYSEAEAIGMDGRWIFTPEDRALDAAEQEIDTALKDGRAENERWHLRKDGSRFWGSGAVMSMLGGFPEGIGASDPVLVKIMRDDTRRVLDEERQKLLLAELQHRVRNLLGMVRSVARQSQRGDVTTDEYVAHLVGRYDAMARTQVLLTRDANAQVDLEGLVREELNAQTGDEKRIVVQGPSTRLSAKAAEVVTLAIHELATNSVKYGVLGEKTGHLSVKWTRDMRDGQEWVRLEWAESGLRELPEARRSGFGTELIERRVPYELRGEGTMRFTPGGLKAEIAFPLFEASSVLETGPARDIGQ